MKTQIPRAFCWTKFGVESGEEAEEIVERKELERQSNDGIFLWGIGNSIRPSLHRLLAIDNSPAVVFTPMRSAAAPQDRRPESVALWCEAVGLDGAPYEIPPYSIVTSRFAATKRRHFALVCSSSASLLGTTCGESVDREAVRNLSSGAPVGSSQVTAIVERGVSSPGASTSQYPVAFMARLSPPYLIELGAPSLLDGESRPDLVGPAERDRLLARLRDLRRASSGTLRAHQALLDV